MPQKKKVVTIQFKRGDVVKILRKARTHERGWKNSWERVMDAAVGHRGIVISGHNNRSHDVVVSGIPGVLDGFGYPDFVLKLVTAAE